MNRSEAKRILELYRPDTPEPADSEMAGALALLQDDPELQAWFTAHQASQSAIRRALRSISPPAGLKEQILSERPAALRPKPWRKPVRVAIVTVCSVALVLFVAQWIKPGRYTDDLHYAGYRTRMVSTALRLYGMDLETNNTAVIRAYLGQRQARADFTIPPGLQDATPTGCGVLSWQGNRVSMICFRSDRPMKEGQTTDLFLFVMRRAAAEDAPAAALPEFTPENRLWTASWSDGDLVYLLAADGDELFLKRYL